MTVSWLFFVAVPFLEALRIYFLSGDIYKLAIQKGEPPLQWILSTIILWVGVEIAVIALWWWLREGEWMVAGVFMGILTARIFYSFFKKSLQDRPDISLDQKIDQIGAHEESGS